MFCGGTNKTQQDRQTEMLLLVKGGFTGRKEKTFLFIMSGFSVFVGLVSGSRRE